MLLHKLDMPKNSSHLKKARAPRIDCRDVFLEESTITSPSPIQGPSPRRDKLLEQARTSTQNIIRHGAPLPLAWVIVLDNIIPPNAVPFTEEYGGPQFIARAYLEGAYHLGKAGTGLLNGALITYGSRHLTVKRYEVLAFAAEMRWSIVDHEFAALQQSSVVISSRESYHSTEASGMRAGRTMLLDRDIYRVIPDGDSGMSDVESGRSPASPACVTVGTSAISALRQPASRDRHQRAAQDLPTAVAIDAGLSHATETSEVTSPGFKVTITPVSDDEVEDPGVIGGYPHTKSIFEPLRERASFSVEDHRYGDSGEIQQSTSSSLARMTSRATNSKIRRLSLTTQSHRSQADAFVKDTSRVAVDGGAAEWNSSLQRRHSLSTLPLARLPSSPPSEAGPECPKDIGRPRDSSSPRNTGCLSPISHLVHLPLTMPEPSSNSTSHTRSSPNEPTVSLEDPYKTSTDWRLMQRKATSEHLERREHRNIEKDRHDNSPTRSISSSAVKVSSPLAGRRPSLALDSSDAKTHRLSLQHVEYAEEDSVTDDHKSAHPIRSLRSPVVENAGQPSTPIYGQRQITHRRREEAPGGHPTSASLSMSEDHRSRLHTPDSSQIVERTAGVFDASDAKATIPFGKQPVSTETERGRSSNKARHSSVRSESTIDEAPITPRSRQSRNKAESPASPAVVAEHRVESSGNREIQDLSLPSFSPEPKDTRGLDIRYHASQPKVAQAASTVLPPSRPSPRSRPLLPKLDSIDEQVSTSSAQAKTPAINKLLVTQHLDHSSSNDSSHGQVNSLYKARLSSVRSESTIDEAPITPLAVQPQKKIESPASPAVVTEHRVESSGNREIQDLSLPSFSPEPKDTRGLDIRYHASQPKVAQAASTVLPPSRPSPRFGPLVPKLDSIDEQVSTSNAQAKTPAINKLLVTQHLDHSSSNDSSHGQVNSLYKARLSSVRSESTVDEAPITPLAVQPQKKTESPASPSVVTEHRIESFSNQEHRDMPLPSFSPEPKGTRGRDIRYYTSQPQAQAAPTVLPPSRPSPRSRSLSQKLDSIDEQVSTPNAQTMTHAAGKLLVTQRLDCSTSNNSSHIQVNPDLAVTKDRGSYSTIPRQEPSDRSKENPRNEKRPLVVPAIVVSPTFAPISTELQGLPRAGTGFPEPAGSRHEQLLSDNATLAHNRKKRILVTPTAKDKAPSPRSTGESSSKIVPLLAGAAVFAGIVVAEEKAASQRHRSVHLTAPSEATLDSEDVQLAQSRPSSASPELTSSSPALTSRSLPLQTIEAITVEAEHCIESTLYAKADSRTIEAESWVPSGRGLGGRPPSPIGPRSPASKRCTAQTLVLEDATVVEGKRYGSLTQAARVRELEKTVMESSQKETIEKKPVKTQPSTPEGANVILESACSIRPSVAATERLLTPNPNKTRESRDLQVSVVSEVSLSCTGSLVPSRSNVDVRERTVKRKPVPPVNNQLFNAEEPLGSNDKGSLGFAQVVIPKSNSTNDLRGSAKAGHTEETSDSLRRKDSAEFHVRSSSTWAVVPYAAPLEGDARRKYQVPVSKLLLTDSNPNARSVQRGCEGEVKMAPRDVGVKQNSQVQQEADVSVKKSPEAISAPSHSSTKSPPDYQMTAVIVSITTGTSRQVSKISTTPPVQAAVIGNFESRERLVGTSNSVAPHQPEEDLGISTDAGLAGQRVFMNLPRSSRPMIQSEDAGDQNENCLDIPPVSLPNTEKPNARTPTCDSDCPPTSPEFAVSLTYSTEVETSPRVPQSESPVGVDCSAVAISMGTQSSGAPMAAFAPAIPVSHHPAMSRRVQFVAGTKEIDGVCEAIPNKKFTSGSGRLRGKPLSIDDLSGHSPSPRRNLSMLSSQPSPTEVVSEDRLAEPGAEAVSRSSETKQSEVEVDTPRPSMESGSEKSVEADIVHEHITLLAQQNIVLQSIHLTYLDTKKTSMPLSPVVDSSGPNVEHMYNDHSETIERNERGSSNKILPPLTRALHSASSNRNPSPSIAQGEDLNRGSGQPDDRPRLESSSDDSRLVTQTREYASTSAQTASSRPEPFDPKVDYPVQTVATVPPGFCTSQGVVSKEETSNQVTLNAVTDNHLLRYDSVSLSTSHTLSGGTPGLPISESDRRTGHGLTDPQGRFITPKTTADVSLFCSGSGTLEERGQYSVGIGNLPSSSNNSSFANNSLPRAGSQGAIHNDPKRTSLPLPIFLRPSTSTPSSTDGACDSRPASGSISSKSCSPSALPRGATAPSRGPPDSEIPLKSPVRVVTTAEPTPLAAGSETTPSGLPISLEKSARHEANSSNLGLSDSQHSLESSISGAGIPGADAVATSPSSTTTVARAAFNQYEISPVVVANRSISQYADAVASSPTSTTTVARVAFNQYEVSPVVVANRSISQHVDSVASSSTSTTTAVRAALGDGEWDGSESFCGTRLSGDSGTVTCGASDSVSETVSSGQPREPALDDVGEQGSLVYFSASCLSSSTTSIDSPHLTTLADTPVTSREDFTESLADPLIQRDNDQSSVAAHSDAGIRQNPSVEAEWCPSLSNVSPKSTLACSGQSVSAEHDDLDLGSGTFTIDLDDIEIMGAFETQKTRQREDASQEMTGHSNLPAYNTESDDIYYDKTFSFGSSGAISAEEQGDVSSHTDVRNWGYQIDSSRASSSSQVSYPAAMPAATTLVVVPDASSWSFSEGVDIYDLAKRGNLCTGHRGSIHAGLVYSSPVTSYVHGFSDSRAQNSHRAVHHPLNASALYLGVRSDNLIASVAERPWVPGGEIQLPMISHHGLSVLDEVQVRSLNTRGNGGQMIATLSLDYPAFKGDTRMCSKRIELLIEISSESSGMRRLLIKILPTVTQGYQEHILGFETERSTLPSYATQEVVGWSSRADLSTRGGLDVASVQSALQRAATSQKFHLRLTAGGREQVLVMDLTWLREIFNWLSDGTPIRESRPLRLAAPLNTPRLIGPRQDFPRLNVGPSTEDACTISNVPFVESENATDGISESCIVIKEADDNDGRTVVKYVPYSTQISLSPRVEVVMPASVHPARIIPYWFSETHSSGAHFESTVVESRAQLVTVKEGILIDDTDLSKSVDEFEFDADSDQAESLHKTKIAILVDDSASMAEWWSYVEDALVGLVDAVNRREPSGVDLFFLHEDGYKGEMQTGKDIRLAFQSKAPYGSGSAVVPGLGNNIPAGQDSSLTARVTDIIEHCLLFHHHLRLVGAKGAGYRPIVILCISDGLSTDLSNVITHTVNHYRSEDGTNSRMFSMLFVVPGKNEQATSALREQLSLVADATSILSADVCEPVVSELDTGYLIGAIVRRLKGLGPVSAETGVSEEVGWH
ncbi:hypothetical protein HYDPIDRAFT_41889 [Hydnomerulius pinastri MD-312]|uniref:Uncharacterized protein n=1 Tax=Hydnomerulius pinastri MD-312 TaxID=994086 RepID=A0A0C9W683_9AGAM|nr:hypothetical protein HYDPIDRAFT_41889 [Hydnomerulius pinastri MD-312]